MKSLLTSFILLLSIQTICISQTTLQSNQEINFSDGTEHKINLMGLDPTSFEFKLFKESGTYTSLNYEKSTGNNCASAPVLTPGAALVCANTVGDNLQVGESAPPCTGFGGGGVTDRTTWFRFTATSTSMVLDYMRTVQTNCASSLAVYGPFASGTGCLPTAGQSIYCESPLAVGDPGDHNLLSGLVVGQDYLIQILNKDCGGPNSGTAAFCIGVSNLASNNAPGTSTVINACGTAFNGNNAQGYYPSGTGTALSNLDGNAGTTCSGCAAGNDVPFVVNNDSWFSFCSANAGVWQVSFTVGTCFQSAPNNGLQMSILTGSSSSLTNLQNAPNPTAPGATWNSANISLSAGQCAYMIVDGFAGDQCTYSYTLTNISGGCVLLPVELSQFNVYRLDRLVKLKWIIESEVNNSHFTVERSLDGVNWTFLSNIESIGDHSFQHTYSYVDNVEEIDNNQTIYYKLSQTDFNGNKKEIAMSAIKGNSGEFDASVIPNPITSENNFKINIDSDLETEGVICLTDNQGYTINKQACKLDKGNNTINWQCDDLKTGIYYLQILTEDRIEIVKFIKI